MLELWKLGHKKSDCLENEKANQAIESASVSDEELDLVLCTMVDVIIDQSREESISLANEVASKMQDKYPIKQVRFVDVVEKAKKKSIKENKSKIRMCNIDGQSFYPFTSRTWIGDSGASCFITNDPTGIYVAEPINESIEAANSLMKAKISVRRMLSSNKT